MTLPQTPAARKPRRLGLYVPLAVLLVVAVAWSGAWVWLRGEVMRRMQAARGGAAETGWRVDWTGAVVSGFPFRLDLDLTNARLGERSGWTILAPRLKAEAFVFAPTHWVAVAPDGVVLTRRRGGAIIVTAKVLRASLSGPGEHPPRLSVEGLGLRFVTPPGAKPIFVTGAAGLHLHTRAGPGDQGAVYLELDQASARLSGLMGRIAGGKPVTFTADALYSHAGEFSGPDWPGAVRAWSEAGGEISVRRLRLAAGEAVFDSHVGSLSVGADGRLRGALSVSLRQGPRALTSMGESGGIAPEAAREAASVVGVNAAGPIATMSLDFQAGRTTLGPVALGSAPRIY
jgi:hypothetical protein